MPDGKGEHAAEAFEAIGAPGAEGFENDFGVAMSAEMVTEGFEFCAEFCEVVDFTVEDNDGVAVLSDDRLIAGAEVDDLEADSAQGYSCVLKDPLLIGTAVGDCLCDELDASGLGCGAQVRKASDTAHSSSLAGMSQLGWIYEDVLCFLPGRRGDG